MVTYNIVKNIQVGFRVEITPPIMIVLRFMGFNRCLLSQTMLFALSSSVNFFPANGNGSLRGSLQSTNHSKSRRNTFEFPKNPHSIPAVVTEPTSHSSVAQSQSLPPAESYSWYLYRTVIPANTEQATDVLHSDNNPIPYAAVNGVETIPTSHELKQMKGKYVEMTPGIAGFDIGVELCFGGSI
jgi:hypothetical protein